MKGDLGLLYRIYNYRAQVIHCRWNPFTFNLSLPEGTVSEHLALDPRRPDLEASEESIPSEVSTS